MISAESVLQFVRSYNGYSGYAGYSPQDGHSDEINGSPSSFEIPPSGHSSYKIQSLARRSILIH